MKKELEDKLFVDYPALYQERHLDKTETCMCWGISCGDGWYALLDRLSAKLTALNLPELRAQQVKEKFGTLRFYVNFRTDELDEAIYEAEMESAKTCERCGKPGKMRNDGGWWRMACDDCWKQS